MRIVSWNVNGLRSLARDGYFGWLTKDVPDVFCLQETKASPEQLPDDVKSPDGYTSYFASSRVKKGYSGVALYTKTRPRKVDLGIGIKRFDDEGRTIVADFGQFVLANAYMPNGGQGPERIRYKLDFYDAFLERVDAVRSLGQDIIFCGDVNTAHEEIDLARPKENEERTGFLPEERAWIDEAIGRGYVDIFRHLHPNAVEYTYWDLKTKARDRNVGWRIDYFFISPGLLPRVESARIIGNILGSDHCPIELTLTDL